MGSPTSMVSHCSTEAPILASSDIHSPVYLQLFKRVLDEYHGMEPCVFILAGDIVDKGVVEAARPVFDLILSKFHSVKIVGVFGNEEYHDRENLFIKNYPYVTWLNDSITIIKCRNLRLGIVGTRGALQRPTRWQRKNMPWLWRVYKDRPKIIKDLIETAKYESDLVVLVSHYALAKGTIIGEPVNTWPEIYSPSMEKMIRITKPNVAIHGHAHKGSPYTILDSVPVYNVALPLNNRIVKICPQRRKTLLDYT